MIGISACLGGVFCRYDGGTQKIPSLVRLVDEGQAIRICPEVLGGLPIPREAAEIVGGDGFDVWQDKAKVLTKEGANVTEMFKQGARTAYQKLQEAAVTQLILKERSPSCGSQMIYDGTFSGTKKTGVGVATAYFLMQGIKVYSEENWQEMMEEVDGNRKNEPHERPL
ncbi:MULTISPECIES: DUF523 domain-containing protein [Enterococcus]|uniref:DUF523 domain-containing protein n=1 Tax=Enterococcus TaxID=1350 RepID=UPI0010FA26B5|nr:MULTISPECIES: DUF523 domain-containing protein [Enterococcus]KAF1301271.1 hypothetical protein BAU16_09745 [Enterococcus sp. JM9B]